MKRTIKNMPNQGDRKVYNKYVLLYIFLEIMKSPNNDNVMSKNFRSDVKKCQKSESHLVPQVLCCSLTLKSFDRFDIKTFAAHSRFSLQRL